MFDGWSLNSATLTDEFVPDETPIYSDLTVYAFWTRSYNVSFFDGFGNLIEVVPVAEGQAASQPRNVLYPDENLDTVFIFDSWDRDVSCVTEDMSVNATWFYSPDRGNRFLHIYSQREYDGLHTVDKHGKRLDVLGACPARVLQRLARR